MNEPTAELSDEWDTGFDDGWKAGYERGRLEGIPEFIELLNRAYERGLTDGNTDD